MMQTDVSSAYVTAASTSVFTGRIRLKGIYVNASGAATVTLTDGSSSGFQQFKMDVPASATSNPVYIPIPGEGIVFLNGIYVATLSGVNSITVFYG